jgi:hypothetical protein
MSEAAVPFIALFFFVMQGGIVSLCLTELARPLGKRAVWMAVAVMARSLLDMIPSRRQT